MQNNEKIILDIIIDNILSEVSEVHAHSAEFDFIVEKILINCGLQYNEIPFVIENVKKSIIDASIADNMIPVKNIISSKISNFVSTLFEDKPRRMDKIAVRNKQSGAIQLVSKKTYQSNSQIYTPLSAGWAKANVVMIRNKTSGEEYPILLKNFDSNKHEKVGSATPPEDEDEKTPLKAKKIELPKNKKDKTPKDTGELSKSNDTVRPMMVAPSLKAKTMTAFITPKSAAQQTQAPEYPSNEDDIIRNIDQSVKDKKLRKTEPTDTRGYKIDTGIDDDEIYEKLKMAGLLSPGFNINKKYSVPSRIKNNLKIPRGYINGVEQLINTIKGDITPISAYSLPIPLSTDPNASISLFELLLLYSVTLSDEDFAIFKISIDSFINSQIESNLTSEMWESVITERTLILKYIIKKYGRSYNFIAGAWKVEEHQMDLGIDNSDVDTERISDIFLRVNTPDEYDALEEFVVSPNKNNILASLDKSKFREYLGNSKEKVKAKILMFIFKMFPIQSVLKNEMTIVFPDVIYDYLTLKDLFSTDSIENLGIKLNVTKNKIQIHYKFENKSGTLLTIDIGDTLDIKIDASFEKACIDTNKKIYN